MNSDLHSETKSFFRLLPQMLRGKGVAVILISVLVISMGVITWLVPDMTAVKMELGMDSAELSLVEGLVRDPEILVELDRKLSLKQKYGADDLEDLQARVKNMVETRVFGSERLEITVRDKNEVFAMAFIQELNTQIEKAFIARRSDMSHDLKLVTHPEKTIQSTLSLRIFGVSIFFLLGFVLLCMRFSFKRCGSSER